MLPLSTDPSLTRSDPVRSGAVGTGRASKSRAVQREQNPDRKYQVPAARSGPFQVHVAMERLAVAKFKGIRRPRY